MTKEEYSIQKVLGTLTYEQRVRSRKNQKKYKYRFRCTYIISSVNLYRGYWKIYLYFPIPINSKAFTRSSYDKEAVFKYMWEIINYDRTYKIQL